MEIYNSFYKLLQNYSFFFYYMHSLLSLDVKKPINLNIHIFSTLSLYKLLITKYYQAND